MKVEYYIAPNGVSPVIEWLDRLKDKKAKARIALRILSIELGNLGDAKPVGGGVSELRIHVGPGYRIYFALKGKEVILLLAAGNKSSQKRDIAKALEYWAHFKAAEKDNEK